MAPHASSLHCLQLASKLWHDTLTLCKYPVTGEGNGTPLQYSCLENPMDGGAW